MQKTSGIGRVINWLNFKILKTIRDNPKTTVRQANQEMNIAEKTIEIARDHGINTEDILKYDVIPSLLLFAEDGMMAIQQKSQLIKDLEIYKK